MTATIEIEVQTEKGGWRALADSITAALQAAQLRLTKGTYTILIERHKENKK